MNNAAEPAKNIGDIAAVGTALAGIFELVPFVASLLAAVYTMIRIAELIERRYKERMWPFHRSGKRDGD